MVTALLYKRYYTLNTKQIKSIIILAVKFFREILTKIIAITKVYPSPLEIRGWHFFFFPLNAFKQLFLICCFPFTFRLLAFFH
jgi:hypothetical protein